MKLIDTNVIIRLLVWDDENQAEASKKLFKRIELGKEHVLLTLPVLFEIVYVLQGVYKHNRASIYEAISFIIELKGINIQGKTTIKRMLEYWVSSKIDLTDCYLLSLTEK